MAVALALGTATAAESFGSLALVTPRPSPGQPYRFFGDRIVKVPLLIHAPEPEGLTIRAELVQLSSNLSAPVAGELEVPLSEYPAGVPRIELDFTVAVPLVNRETDFELRFRSRRNPDRAWHAAGRIALRVYPVDLLGPIRTWAQSHPLSVEDDDGSLTEFLRMQRIPVAAQPDATGVTLYAGPRALQKQKRLLLRDDETAILFTAQETETPHILIDRTGSGTTVRVEMQLLERLATDPLAQKIFLEVFHYVYESAPPTKGVIR